MWVPITLAAATFQILRTARQHALRSVLSTAAAGFVRYAYGAPLAIALALLLFGVLDRDLPDVPTRFWPAVAVAGASQIVGTLALLQSFRIRDFAIGTVYSKTEVLIVAVLGLLGLDARLSALGWVGVVLVTIGVVWLASRGSVVGLLQRAGDPAALMGVVAAAGFAGAAVGIGRASSSLGDAPSFDRAVLTLTAVLVFQTVINGVWFLLRDPAEIGRTIRAWRPALWVGVFSLLGSIGWAWGFTLASAVEVRTLGQVELIIAFGIAHVTLGERHTRRDVAASAVVLAGVVLVTTLG